ncbi:MAG: lysophospholipid acyltransferase family protein [Bdellovibrionales bacterium]|nr:lysophospholipid acyltransferase family protein [Bdellovibrionales bacterium]
MTVFNTPTIKHFLKFIGFIILKSIGWKADPRIPTLKKYVVIVYPHTSNWDFPIGMAYTFLKGHNLHWMGKNSLFKGFAGPIMRWLGGISINRKAAQNVVGQTVEKYNNSEELIVVIPPEGTRGAGNCWKSGFYRIARQANVPVVCAYIDYQSKMVGMGEVIELTGDEEADLHQIRQFYEGKVGLHPEDMAPICFKEREKKGTSASSTETIS